MKRWLAAIPLAALIGLTGLGLVQLYDGTRPEFERVSRAAPDPLMATLAGSEVQLSDLAAEAPILVNFWASWCSPCRVEHPLLMQLADRYPGRLHGVLYEDTTEAGRAFLDELGNPFTVIGIDADGQIALDFGHTGVPETFVVTPDGEIALHIRGQLLPEHLDEIDAAMRDASEGHRLSWNR